MNAIHFPICITNRAKFELGTKTRHQLPSMAEAQLLRIWEGHLRGKNCWRSLCRLFSRRLLLGLRVVCKWRCQTQISKFVLYLIACWLLFWFSFYIFSSQLLDHLPKLKDATVDRSIHVRYWPQLCNLARFGVQHCLVLQNFSSLRSLNNTPSIKAK